MRGSDSTRHLRLAPLTREEAELTAEWRYEPGLATDNGVAAAVADVLDPGNQYHSIRLEGEYIGYVCVGPDARVAGLPGAAGIDDIGIGLAPEHVGRGLSRWLLQVVLVSLESCGVLKGAALRAVVLDWNGRSLRAAQRAGFAIAGEHRVGERRFMVLTRPRTSHSDRPL